MNTTHNAIEFAATGQADRFRETVGSILMDKISDRLAIEKITNGFIPVTIKGGDLRLDRQDIWGTQFKHEEKSKRKIIPIKVVSEKIGTIDNIEVYGKSRVEA